MSETATHGPLTLVRLLTGSAAWFLSGATRVTLRVREVEPLRLALEGDASPLPEAVRPGSAHLPWPVILQACTRWELKVVGGNGSAGLFASGEGGRLGEFERKPADAATVGSTFEFEVDALRVAGDFQSPDVLLALRRQAAEHPEATFTVVLPPGTRDLQRARAGLPSA